jgi:GAF domain-containing protein
MRALGSPDLLLRNIARVSHKFNWSHNLEPIDRERGRVRLPSATCAAWATPPMTASAPRLARWVHLHGDALRRGALLIDDLTADAELAPLAADPAVALGSACAAALVYGDRLLGAKIALAPGLTVFFPKDLRSPEIYAGHAAIALWNGRLVERLELYPAEDALTGLANRRALNAACATELDRMARHGGSAGLIEGCADLFADADRALHAVKRKRRGRTVPALD